MFPLLLLLFPALLLSGAGLASAQSWPPSSYSSLPTSNAPWVASCTQAGDSDVIPAKWAAGIAADFNDENSPIGQLIKSVCDASFGASHSFGSCSGNQCELKADTPFYTATYKINKLKDGQAWQFCLEAPFAIRDKCKIGSANSPRTGRVANSFNGDNQAAHQSYDFSITPKLPYPTCFGASSSDITGGVNEAGNVLQVASALCGADACTQPGAEKGCNRRIMQSNYAIRAHRQNFGTKVDFSNCKTALEAIIQQCYQKGQGGGEWGTDPSLGVDGSQEYYSLTFDKLQDDIAKEDGTGPHQVAE